ncbi:bifunctional riboflavin kinase/FAD synthetase [Marivibrio halodurans]|uniref:Riboflavin biosynthesis protein n=1 Tax=Marivibrio halodurans TaxID=2039722 RepID=A0A8J7S533_9PROT|nr:bifunctional riboflavin kinase/FAD synthetase [Marivibrio halodurans]MBP5858944.1 bifunctional riboflavin kinase/FAD synthetase [Marivibrio halodurans]
MQIIQQLSDYPADRRGAVLAIGNFDGVHRGHQAVIGQAARIAEAEGAPLGVLTFEPHPVCYFKPDVAPFRLTPLRSKAHHLQALGLDLMICLPFERALAELTADAFIGEVLVRGLGLSHLVVGYDFRFGKGRAGTVETLKADGRFRVTVVDPSASAAGEVYSSTRIREHLKAGEPGQAAALLGRPFEVEGIVAKGRQLGRTIGFPTANIDLGDYVRPAHGVYAVRCGVSATAGGAPRWLDGVANWGRRPTVDGIGEVFEVYLFDFDGDLYGTSLRIALIEFIRPEKKFDGIDALKTAIAEDCRAAHVILDTRAAGA